MKTKVQEVSGEEIKKMKRSLIKIFSLPNVVIMASALYICFQIYELPAKVKILQERISTVEKENIALKTQINLVLNAVYEMRADIKQILGKK